MTPLKQILTADAVLAQWEARRTREHALTIVVRRHLPRPLAPRIHVVDARSGELELAADAGAVAAMLRQRSADLLAALRSQGWEFTGIRVRVQVCADPGPRPKASVNQPDRSSLQSLAALARRLPRGALKAALEQFLRRAG
ncbi:MAG TPA: DciA family protein [Casimicrobiaceae bacterium]|nr:DciA family protein [Casimicrobiaceae bacterium]